jgi:hypothetical protein
MAVMMPIALKVIVRLALSGRYSLRPTGNGAAAGSFEAGCSRSLPKSSMVTSVV